MPNNQIEIAAFEAVHAIQACTSKAALHQTLLDFIENFGFDHYIISAMPPPGFKLEPHILMQNWPQAWFDHYIEKRLYDHDPIARCIETTMQPHRWVDIVESRQFTNRQKNIMLEATEFGLNDGYIIPIFGATSLLSCVSLSGQHVELPPPAADALFMVGMYAHGVVYSIVEAEEVRVKKNTKLTHREREILSWVANGKTDAEIAIICNISHKTAGHHVSSAIEKMGAVNRTQAVAYALVTRQITLQPNP